MHVFIALFQAREQRELIARAHSAVCRVVLIARQARRIYVDAAWKLVEYITSKEGQEILSSTGFQIPVYESVAMSEDFVEAEKTKGPQNYEVFVQSAKKQGYGLWQYRSSITWKTNIYDTPSEFLFAENESDRKTVKQFLEEAKAKAASELG